MFLDKTMDPQYVSLFKHGPLGPRIKKKVRKKNDGPRRIVDHFQKNYGNENNVTPYTIRKKRSRPPQSTPLQPPKIVSEKKLKAKWIPYLLQVGLYDYVIDYVQQEIDKVKPRLLELERMQEDQLFQKYCNSSDDCSIREKIILFHQIFGRSGDIIEEFYTLFKKEDFKIKKDTPTSRVLVSMCSSIRQQFAVVENANDTENAIDADGDIEMNDETQTKKQKKRQAIREVKGKHVHMHCSEDSSRCFCGSIINNFRIRKKKKY